MRIKDCEGGHDQMEQFVSVSVLIYRYSARRFFWGESYIYLDISIPLSIVILACTSLEVFKHHTATDWLHKDSEHLSTIGYSQITFENEICVSVLFLKDCQKLYLLSQAHINT